MKHYIYFGNNNNQPKNKLQKTLVEYLKELDGFITNSTDRSIQEIRRKVTAMNLEYHRCTALTVVENKLSRNGIGVSFGSQWYCQIFFYAIKE